MAKNDSDMISEELVSRKYPSGESKMMRKKDTLAYKDEREAHKRGVKKMEENEVERREHVKKMNKFARVLDDVGDAFSMGGIKSNRGYSGRG